MYTICRFTKTAGNVGDGEAIGLSMNAVRPGVYSGLRRSGDGFACQISVATSWEEHGQAIKQFIEELGREVDDAVRRDFSVTIDTAIEPEDRAEAATPLVVRLGPDLARLLAARGVAFEVSVY